MSITTTPTNMQEFHGISLAQGAAIANLVIERVAVDPVAPEIGRAWFNTVSKSFKFVMANEANTAVVVSYATATELADAISAYDAKLASTTAGEGSGLVGYAGKTGANALVTITAGTIEASLDSLITGLDQFMKDTNDASSSLLTDLASEATDADGAKLVGFDGYTSTNGHVTIPAGNVSDSLDKVAADVDAAIEAGNGDSVSKTDTADQSIESNVNFKKDIVVDGNLTILGENTVLEGNTLEIGDNIIELNKDVAVDAVPLANAGWSVNRGIEGKLEVSIWDETEKQLTAPRLQGSAFGIAEGLTEDGIARVILGDEFDKQKTVVDTKLDELDAKVGDNIGDPADLVTEDKSNLVAAINEVHQDGLDTATALVADAGSELVGYAGKTGTNTLVTVVAGTVAVSLDSVVEALDAEMKSTDDQIADYAATDAGKGGSLVGYVGQGLAEDAFYLPAGTVTDGMSAVVGAIKTDRETAATLAGSVDALVDSINANKFTADFGSQTTHTIVHNLNSESLNLTLWVKDGLVWKNHMATCEIIDANTIEYTLQTTAEIRVVIEAAEDISRG